MKLRFNRTVERRKSGIALVITLILMSVALLMAVAFMLISRREQAAVATQSDDTTARLAADSALANAEAQIVANVLASPQPNPYNFGLIVSTNYINPFGFQPGIASPTNVNYDLLAGGGALNQDQRLQLLGNLFYSPRLPVFVPTNQAGQSDFRFYLDLNQNGQFEPNTNTFGDPEWIGILERPDISHGPNNKATSRFAFIAIPIGNSLDINAIHNQTLNRPLTTSPNSDGYFRNQGVGSWELNLAAFLADLNTNEWFTNNPGGAYTYLQPGFANVGAAFNDAFSILTNRYAGDYNTLAPANNLFQNAANVFPNDGIDGYSDEQLQTTLDTNADFLADNPSLPWAGADNTNHFFNLPNELFDPNKTANFGPHLLSIGQAYDLGNGDPTNDYNRNTFYRLLSQLGTDSDPESGKMNLNYDNLDAAGNVVPNAETNFIPWTPLRFFTNAADRMLRAYTARWASAYATNEFGFVTNFINTNFVATFNVTNSFGLASSPSASGIPVWVSNRFVYTPAVQRILQLAANIYDATTNNSSGGSPDWPDVFRPLFTKDGNGNVFVSGYTNVSVIADPVTDFQFNLPVEPVAISGTNVIANVYGVPWIIGAKKGFPNFNAFSMESVFSLTRKLQVTRPSTNITYGASPNSYTTSQQLALGVTNMLGVECWNSYIANFTNFNPNGLAIYVYDTNQIVLTNDEGTIYPIGSFVSTSTNFTLWPGYSTISSGSFIIPLNTNLAILPASIYQFGNLAQPFTTNLQSQFYTNYLQPHWTMMTTNRLRVIMVDQDAGGNYHVIDYVHLNGPDSTRDLTAEVRKNYDTATQSGPNFNGYNDMWDTNLDNQGVPYGIDNQLNVSLGVDTINISYWNQLDGPTVTNEINGFRAFYGKPPFSDLPGSTPNETRSNAVDAAEIAAQAPYTPTATVVQLTKWEVNDPLVHYIASDLTDLSKDGFQNYIQPLSFGTLNDRYMPWGRGLSVANADSNPNNLAFKDPWVSSSDDWDFLAEKLPAVGWLGRVHRGTPWQTVYLKSTNILSLNFKDAKGNAISGLTTWFNWTGNGNGFDQTNNAPVEDRLLFDLFTTALNDNATRGQLSVNVGSTANSHNLAAWSALFSGAIVLSNNLPDSALTLNRKIISYSVFPIAPAGVGTGSPLYQLAAGIDATRGNFQNHDGVRGVFEHTGDILATPQLTEQSPYLQLLTTNGTPDLLQQTNGINDEMYEWLPQQVMSLLRTGSNRYIIYSWGQALKAAPNGIYTGTSPSGTFGMVTNYQVVAEAATRAVIRIEGAPTNTHAVIESFNILPPN